MNFNSQNLTWILILFGLALFAGWYLEGNWLLYLAIALVASIYLLMRKQKKN